MTSRIGKPYTDADRQLHALLDSPSPSSFVMVAGAGSGKTTSLIKALDHLVRTRGAALRRRGQRIACITFTEVAAGEIWGDVGNVPLVQVNTIHSFLWSVARPFQHDIRFWVTARIEEKIAEAQARIDKPGTRPATRETLTNDIERYQAQIAALPQVRRFTYGTGSDYANGVLGHDDILRITPSLATDHPLLRKLIASQFPFIFVDESQDTNPTVVEALKLVAQEPETTCCLGFFGDPMQKIYLAGAGPIELGEGWEPITKPENFRCPTRVLEVINRIRAEDDKLEQTGGRTETRDGVVSSVEGSARLFILPADGRRTERLAEVQKWLAAHNDDPLWDGDHGTGDIRLLVLVHRMAANRLGFGNLYAALNDNGAHGLKDGLLDGTAWALRPFINHVLPLALSARDDDKFAVMTAVRANCPLLAKDSVANHDLPQVLTKLAADVESLEEMLRDGSSASVRELVQFIHDNQLLTLDDRFASHLAQAPGTPGEGREDGSMSALFDCNVSELWAYRTYIEDRSPFATQQGIKGAEFQRVLVVLDDEEGAYNLFSYGKYFGLVDLSAKDQENEGAGIDSVLGRTRRLFYVCCSRAVKDLAVVLFVPDPAAARTTIAARGIFPADEIYVEAEL